MVDQSDLQEPEGIAVIGMACRFPGADTPGEYWRNLADEIESIRVEDRDERGEGRVRAHSRLTGIDQFDAEFFGYSTREADLLDPQHRLFLECSWEALEDGGVAGRRLVEDIGVYGGSGSSLYLMNNLHGQATNPTPNYLDSAADLQLALAADRDYLASRVCYKLGLTGPSVNVQAACATSLYALHLACQAILNGECDLALAGGVHVPVPQIDSYVHEPGLVFSEDGHCRVFDAAATGTVFGSGVGVVLLKPLEKALADHDRIYAVVRGTAINNDGSGKPGFSAPSVVGQTAVIRQALAAAGVEPESVSYVEAHGTGTLAGDPVEVTALAEAFTGCPPRSCALGSVKTNIGHLGWAAGIAGVIKTALALTHRTIPASLNFREPNPAIDFERTPFYVNTTTSEWQRDAGPLRAGVSAFGLGGTNAHVILEEAPRRTRGGEHRDPADRAGAPYVIPLSARTRPALQAQAARMRTSLRDAPERRCTDVAFSLGEGRRHFPERTAVMASERQSLVDLLDAVANGQEDLQNPWADEMGIITGTATATAPRIAALFTGQGTEYLEVGRRLHESEPAFRDTIRAADETVSRYLGEPLSSFLYKNPVRRGMEIDDIAAAQTVNYVLQAALSNLWRSWGVEPDVYLGHSLGEYAAAYGAGVFDFETGLYLVSERGRLLKSLPDNGAMAAVFASEDQVAELLSGTADMSIAAVNTPNSVVVSGERRAVADVVQKAEHRGLKCKPLPITRAGHSPLIDPILDAYTAVLEGVTLCEPTRTIISNLTGGQVVAEIATASYWRDQLRNPVRFLDAVRAADAMRANVFMELGPSHALSTMAQLALQDDGTSDRTWLETLRWETNDTASVRRALATAYTSGVEVDWSAVHPDAHMVSVPTYPFQRRRHWTDPAEDDGRERRPVVRPADARSHGDLLEADSDTPRPYAIHWTEAAAHPAGTLAGRTCMLVGPESVLLSTLARSLEQAGADVRVFAGQESGSLGDMTEELAALLAEAGPDLLINAWPLIAKRTEDLRGSRSAHASVTAQVYGAAGGVVLAVYQALSRAGRSDIRALTLTSGAQCVSSADDPAPAQGALMGVYRTARAECWHLSHKALDIDPEDVRRRWDTVVSRLPHRIAQLPRTESELALRDGRFLAPRLAPEGAVDDSAPIDPDGWYLVTGGTAGVGRVFAHALLELGVKKLVLCHRRQLDAAAERSIAELRESFGAEIVARRVDVRASDQVDRLVAEYSVGPGLRGIVHAAGVIDDGILDHMDRARMERVLRPKAQGAWNLHESTARHAPELNLFVMTSSSTGLFGNEGQANHAAASTYLDALAHHRRARGLPGLSLDLGAWSGIGFLHDNDEVVAELRRTGVGTIDPDAGRIVVRGVLRCSSTGQMAVLPVRWSALDPAHRLANNPITVDLAHAVADSSGRGRPGESSSRASRCDIETACTDVVSGILGERGESAGNGNLLNSGMDSLRALSIRNALQKRLGVLLPMSVFFDNPTVGGLVDELVARMNFQ
jgi:acyl transferase domain-containing protein/acyl carrier protein